MCGLTLCTHFVFIAIRIYSFHQIPIRRAQDVHRENIFRKKKERGRNFSQIQLPLDTVSIAVEYTFIYRLDFKPVMLGKNHTFLGIDLHNPYKAHPSNQHGSCYERSRACSHLSHCGFVFYEILGVSFDHRIFENTSNTITNTYRQTHTAQGHMLLFLRYSINVWD